MDRRRALATVAAVTFGAAAIAAAVGATTRVFNVAEASPGVGRVSPVSPTLPPVVEHRVIDVEDTLPDPDGHGDGRGAGRAGHRSGPDRPCDTTGRRHVGGRDADRSVGADTDDRARATPRDRVTWGGRLIARRRRPAAAGRILAAGAAVGTFGFAIAGMATADPTPARPPVAAPAPAQHWVFVEVRHHPAPVAAATPPVAGGTPAPAGSAATSAARASAPPTSATTPASAAAPTPPPTIRVAPTPTPTVATTGAS